jgi:16S rRNA A1518/A1519 N6-dimethyltransferase RsmA/KsgA/DIM1 with predicted DNA glycosylase/AP lyase activity
MLGIDNDTVAYEEFKTLVHRYGIKTIVETGTWIGNTTEALATLSDNVYTVEINADSYNKACKRFKENKNVKLFN